MSLLLRRTVNNRYRGLNQQWQYESFRVENGDLKELLGLMSNEYGEVDPAHVDYFNWYCRDNPAGQALVPIARDPATGHIIGGFWLVALRARVEGESYKGSATVNIVVNPDYRRKQVAVSLLNYCVQLMQDSDFDFLSSFPNPRMSHVVDQSLWERVGPQDLLFRPLNWSFLRQTPLGKWPFLTKAAATIANGVWPFIFRPRSTSSYASKFTIEEETEFDGAFDKFWHRVQDKYPIMYVRDATFLRWRYMQNPRRTYTVLVARQAGDIIGYLVIRASKIRHFRAGFIADFLVEASERGDQAGQLLIAEATQRLQSQVEVVVSMIHSHFHEAQLLHRQGFITCPRRLQPLRVLLFTKATRDHDSLQPALKKLDSWFLQLADFDIV